MKLLLFIIIIRTILFCQNKIDPISVIGDTTANYSNIIHEQERFLIGWNWGNAGRNIDNALNVNFYHAYPKEGQASDDEYADSILVSQNANGFIIGGILA